MYSDLFDYISDVSYPLYLMHSDVLYRCVYLVGGPPAEAHRVAPTPYVYSPPEFLIFERRGCRFVTNTDKRLHTHRQKQPTERTLYPNTLYSVN